MKCVSNVSTVKPFLFSDLVVLVSKFGPIVILQVCCMQCKYRYLGPIKFILQNSYPKLAWD